MGFRFIDQLPQFFNASGQVLSGGQLAFYESGTTTPLNTYTDDTLTQANPNPLELDSTGRPTADIWMNGNYRVVLMDGTGATIWTRDNVQQPGGTTFSLPALVAGQFLSNNGTAPLWAPVVQVPSPAGASGKVLSTDGSNLFWIPAPTNGTPGTPGTNASVTVTATDVKWSGGSGALAHYQMGAASAPTSGNHTTTTTVTFPIPFATTPVVMASVSNSAFASSGYLVALAITNVSTTGFTIAFDTNSSDGSNGNIIAPVPFNWIAFGTTAT